MCGETFHGEYPVSQMSHHRSPNRSPREPQVPYTESEMSLKSFSLCVQDNYIVGKCYIDTMTVQYQVNWLAMCSALHAIYVPLLFHFYGNQISPT